MSTYTERLVLESVELNDKIKKLNLFIGTDNFNSLSQEYRQLLVDQVEAMTTYADILHKRLAYEFP